LSFLLRSQVLFLEAVKLIKDFRIGVKDKVKTLSTKTYASHIFFSQQTLEILINFEENNYKFKEYLFFLKKL